VTTDPTLLRSRSHPAGHSGPTLRLRISSIAKGGEGVAHADINGQPRGILVARTAPGDLVEAVVRKVGGALRGEVASVLEASHLRVEPSCPYANTCGGCDFMHLSLDAQRHARAQIVRDALGPLCPADGLQQHFAPHTEHYRQRVRLAVEAHRGRALVGFRSWRSHQIVAIESCLVAQERIDQARSEIAPWLAQSDGQGEATVSTGFGGLPAIYLAWQGELSSTVYSEAEERVRSGAWAGVEISLQGAREPAVIGDSRTVATGCDGAPLVAPPGGFVQVFSAMNEALGREVVSRASASGRKVLELFAGSGNFTVGLAREAPTIETVESDARAVELARENLASRGIKARLRCADADQFEINDDVRLVVLDPPRAGAPGASRRIAASRARRVVMVSCDPATMTRDASTLAASGFVVISGGVFEMFPHTSHVETVLVMQRENMARRR